MQTSLFPKEIPIPDLQYFEGFISKEEELNLIQQIDDIDWMTDLKRRVQHYGYKYDYKSRRIDLNMKIGELPTWVDFLIQRFLENKIFQKPPDQLIINEYFQGQGIAAHIDCEPCFEDTVVSISLNSDVIMDFSKEKVKIPFVLNQRSLVVLKGESRYDWKHGIAARKSDQINGIKKQRTRRISLTFRRVILNDF